MEDREAFWKAIEKLVRDSNIVIDRPKGTTHPRFPDLFIKLITVILRIRRQWIREELTYGLGLIRENRLML